MNFLMEFRGMLLKACFLGTVCVDLPVFDCRLTALKAGEKARQSNKRELIG